jgi:hypothetical protein
MRAACFLNVSLSLIRSAKREIKELTVAVSLPKHELKKLRVPFSYPFFTSSDGQMMIPYLHETWRRDFLAVSMA